LIVKKLILIYSDVYLYLKINKIMKQMSFTLDELEKYADKYDTPYYIYDETQIRNNAIKYMDTFRMYFPNFKQFYAVKACPNPSILRIVSECGMGFDCSSPEEIKISQIASPTSQIMYSSNYTSKKDLRFAFNNECIINLDSIDGLYNLSLIPELICFRFNPVLSTDVDVKSNSFAGTNTKFGMTKEYIIKAYKEGKMFGIKRFGLHTMCASNQLDPTYWDKIIDSVFELVSILRKINIQIEFVNIGGGIGIPYRPTDTKIDLEQFCINLRNRFNFNIQKYNIESEPSLYTECGRYITGPYGYLVSRCQSIKNNEETFYGLDANMSNLMRPGMYDAYHHISVPRLEHSNETIKANVVGTLCENNDWFCKQRKLPKGILKGDLFVIHDCGAHAFSMGFNYNSKLRSCELLKTFEGIQLIRDRETFTSLFGNTRLYNENNPSSFDCNMVYSMIVIYCILLYIFFDYTMDFNQNSLWCQ